MKVVGIDPSYRNWGMCKGEYSKGQLHIDTFELVQIKNIPQVKRQNEKDFYVFSQLYKHAKAFTEDADIIIAEIPTGSQSSRAMVSYAGCIAVLAALQAEGRHLIGVTPNQVKKVLNNPYATKEEIITWVLGQHPYVQLPTHHNRIATTKAEHLCDSIVAIHAAILAGELHEN